MENETALTPNERIAVEAADKIGLKMFDVNDRKSLLSLIKWLDAECKKQITIATVNKIIAVGDKSEKVYSGLRSMTESIYGAGSGSRTND